MGKFSKSENIIIGIIIGLAFSATVITLVNIFKT